MTKKSYQPPAIEIRNLTIGEIDSGIKKIKRRIEEVQSLDPNKIRYDDAQIDTIESNIRNTIREIFGGNSPEFREHGYLEIWKGGHAMMEPEYSLQRKFAEGIPHTLIKLNGLIARLEEKKEDLAGFGTSQDTPKEFWNEIHPAIVTIAKSRFDTGHYADSVESALKHVNSVVKDIVKRKIGKELDGADLMHTAFSPNNPIIVLDDLSTDSGKNIQQGYMQIFAGSMIGIRNPKAHDNLDITDVRAKHFIYLASLLMQKVDERI